ncbi:hypothetical protein, partial [Pseudonocardia aurantiaca]
MTLQPGVVVRTWQSVAGSSADAARGHPDLVVEIIEQGEVGGEHLTSHRTARGGQRVAGSGHQSFGHRPADPRIAAGGVVAEPLGAQAGQPRRVREVGGDQPTDLA